MFSQTSEYALRVVLCLAAAEGRPLTIPQLAQATRTPAGYLAKVLRNLARAELVVSQRGLGGGSVLARPAEQITVYDVIQAVDPIKRITTCPLKIPSHGVNLCPLHRRLDDAIGLVEQAFRASSIADLISEETGTKPLSDPLTDLAARAFPVKRPRRPASR
jgi:Rrf2 family transcriptional regulator, nitric oxide-sensitive transcriptional repressor